MRIVVVGAGVVGLAAGYRLVKDGHDVTVLDSQSFGLGPSYGNAALVTDVLSFPVPAPGSVSTAARSLLSADSAITVAPGLRPSYAAFLLRMALATRPGSFALGTIAQDTLCRIAMASFDEYRDDGLEFEEHRRGSLHVFETAAEYDAAMALFEPYPAIRDRIRPLASAAEIEDVDPLIDPAYTHGYYAPGDRQVEPVSFMAALVAALRAQGAGVVEHTPVVSFVVRGGRVRGVATTAGVLDCDAVVIAAGVASRELAGRLGFDLPLYPGGGYSVDVAVPESLSPATSVLTSRTHIAVTPLDRGLRASSGMIIGQRRPVVDERRIARLLRDLAHLYPGVPLSDRSAGWAGLRPMSADGVPVIGLVPGTSNAFLATGHAMLGLTLAPATAQVLSELVSGAPVPAAYELLAPARFGGRRTGRWRVPRR